MTATTDDQRNEHILNLQHLAAQVQGEVVIKGLLLQAKAQDLFIRILGVIINTIIAAEFHK